MSTNATSTINDLIETLKDGQEGFRAAAAGVKSPDLRAQFTEYSNQRAQYSGELQALARTLGDPNPENSSSVASTVHRGWINLKAAVTGQDDHSILEECERGEDVAVDAFRSALAADLPANVRAIVQRQSVGVQAAHDRVKALRDALAPV
jgi:uncharacterized protein (TIGR02284 family)